MGSEEKIKIDIIGAGQVVQEFLKENLEKNPSVDIRVYMRQSKASEVLAKFARPIHTFEPSDRITVLCLSIAEERILKVSNSKSRMDVARENLIISDNLVKKGFFENQVVFVLTNPSELIAEYIYRNSKNKHIYALGLNTDQRRYSKILKQPEFSKFLHSSSNFSVSGNHYDFPCPLIDPLISKFDEDTTIDLLKSTLQIKIKNEFKGNRPPVDSGVTALKDLTKALVTKKPLYLSGYCDEFDCFNGGSMNFDSFLFSPSLGNSVSSKARIKSIAKSHRDAYFKITSSQSLKESI